MQPVKNLATVSLFIALAGATPAKACGGDPYNTGFLHRSLPDGPRAAFAAEVEIVSMRMDNAISGESEGRIVKMLRGSYAGSKIIVRSHLTSCDQLPWPGQKGIVAGEVISSSDAALVIKPVRTKSERQIYFESQKQTPK